MPTRLQTVAYEFMVADEALRRALLRAEKAEATIARLRRLMQPKQPKRIAVQGRYGLEIWSVPLEDK